MQQMGTSPYHFSFHPGLHAGLAGIETIYDLGGRLLVTSFPWAFSQRAKIAPYWLGIRQLVCNISYPTLSRYATERSR